MGVTCSFAHRRPCCDCQLRDDTRIIRDVHRPVQDGDDQARKIGHLRKVDATGTARPHPTECSDLGSHPACVFAGIGLFMATRRRKLALAPDLSEAVRTVVG